MAKVIVLHAMYGCDTGCCGHIVQIGGQEGSFQFKHPRHGESVEEFVKRFVTEHCGEEHVKDIDFENCIVVDD
jgi:hypothetical protein